jgi:hypothetical protein
MPMMVAFIIFGAINAQAYPRYWGLLVGQDYSDSVGGNWAQEAGDMYNALMSWSNWSEYGQVYPQTHSFTRSQLVEGFDWLASNAGPDDVVFFYYSGHASTLPDDDGDEINSLDETLYSTDEIKIRDDEVAQMFQGINTSARKVGVFSSCGMGGMVGGSQDLNIVPNTTLLMSCSENGATQMIDLFEEALQYGVKDREADLWEPYDQITTYEWFIYGKNHTPLENQIPQYYSNMSDDLILFSNLISTSIPNAESVDSSGSDLSSTPEPATLILLGTGLIGLVGYSNRKQRKIILLRGASC